MINNSVQFDGFEQTLSLDVQEALEDDAKIYWGKCRPFLFYRKKPIIVTGPHWPLFLGALTAFGVISLVMIKFTINHNMQMLTTFLAVLVSLSQLTSFLMVGLKNPGIANLQEELPDKIQISRFKKVGQFWHCEVCNIDQTPKTVHCGECQICILDMDHHCPWTGKCIGSGNIKYFYMFLTCTLAFMLFNLAITFSQAQQNINKNVK